MKSGGKILIASGVLSLGLIIGGFLIPSEWEVSDNTVIHINSTILFAQLSDLRNWQKWNGWSQKFLPNQNPDCKNENECFYADHQGTVSIFRKVEPEKIIMKFDFPAGFNFTAVLYLNAENAQTCRFTWKNFGETGFNFAARYYMMGVQIMMKDELHRTLSEMKQHFEDGFKK